MAAAPRFDHISFTIVDDSDHMRRLIRAILQVFGVHNVREASDGSEALKQMEHGPPPDILLTNWHMAPLNGVELTRHIRLDKDSPNPYMPIIMITGYAERGRVLQARDAGVTEYLIKPVSAKSLYARIQAVVMRPRPFVRTKSFFGPDRRRHGGEFHGQEKRRGVAVPVDQVMTQHDVNTLFEGGE